MSEPSCSNNTATEMQNPSESDDFVWGELKGLKSNLKNLPLVTGSYIIGRNSILCDYELKGLGDLDRSISNTHFRLTKDMTNIHSPVYIEVSYYSL